MNILKLATKLKEIYDEHGDIPVMHAADAADSPFEVWNVEFREVEDIYEYPEYYLMPPGFKFVLIS